MFQPYIRVFHQTVDYYEDLTKVFHTLCGQKSNCLLLESAEISSKNSLKSLLLINAAVKITCL
ncbi:MAG: anthranilate synthase component I, partial [[Actinobacillus] rossii]|nr:anthranilate synthase component I [[Actinobacillus] rossii]